MNQHPLKIILITLIFFGMMSASFAEAAPIVAAGSGANLDITRLLADAFMKDHPAITISVPGSIGTKGAIAAVADKAITLGLISRPLKEAEKSPETVTVPYAQTPIVIGVHPSVSENEISSKDLVDIYAGTKLKWQNGSDIVVQIREAFDSGFSAVGDTVPEFKTACDESRKAEKWAVYFTDQAANTALASTHYAIGITDIGMILSNKLTIKPLTFNGMAPTMANLVTGAYPFKRTLFIIYRNDVLTEDAKAFLDFIRSEAGKNILQANGYLPA